MNERYLIYLTGKSEKFDSLQKHLQLIYPETKISSLGMHCTMLPFYSIYAETILIKEFNDMNFPLILSPIKDACLFDNESIVLKLTKTSSLEKIHYDCISKFTKYSYSVGEILYVGEKYTPHLTLGHVSHITSLTNLPEDFNVKREIVTLDKLVLARGREEAHKWRTLADKTLL